MKRALLFVGLAAGGLAGLGVLAGGFSGSNSDTPTPVVAEIVGPARRPGLDERVTMDELPIGNPGRKGAGRPVAPIELDPVVSFNQTIAEEATFTDPGDGARIEIPNAPKAWVRFREAATMRDSAGSPGLRWKGVHIVLYRDKRDYTRADAEALRANPKSGRKGLELYDITADEGFETTTPLPPTADQREPKGRTVVHITKNVVIYDYARKLFVRTSDAVVDYEAQTAEGAEAVEAESSAYVVRGRGFRIDVRAMRLEILENTEFDALDLATARPGRNGADDAMRPRRARAKGSTVIVRHADERAPWTDVRMDGGVHVEMEGGQQLDGQSIALRLVKRTLDAATAPTAPPDGAPDPTFEGVGLEKLTADGDVRYEGKDKDGALLTATGPRLTIEFAARDVQSMRLAGRSRVTWRGDIAMPGERPADRIVSASAAESLLFAPDAESDDASMLDLVGAARVECGRMPVDATPQRLAADRITLRLRRRPVPDGAGDATTAPARRRQGRGAEWIATSFSATGGVVLAGPRLSGAAREMKGFDLDHPVFRITAVGPDVHLEVADDAPPRRDPRAQEHGSNAASAGRTPPPGPRPTWLLDRVVARSSASGSLRVRAGEGAASFTGEEFTYGRRTGAMIRGRSGGDAHLTLEGREGRDRTVEASTIELRTSDDERVLVTTGRTTTTFWIGDDEPSAPVEASGPGSRVVELRSTSRIDVVGSRGGKTTDATLAVTLTDGAAISARTDDVLTDRLTARSIELSLVETIPAANDAGFALPGRRTPGTASSAPKPGRAATVPPRGPAAGRYVTVSDALTLSVGLESRAGSAGRLRRVQAAGRVVATGEDAKEGPRKFEGERFDFDAANESAVLLGTAKAGAVVTLGSEPTLDRIVSPRIDVFFKNRRLTRAVFAAPVRGMFHTKTAPGDAARVIERYLLESLAGPLTVEGSVARVEGSVARPVVVQRIVRSLAGAPIGDPLTITTPRLTLTTSAEFGASGATLVALDADGQGTRLDTGHDAATRAYAIGDTLRYERPANARKGTPGADGSLKLTSARGAVRVARPGQMFEGHEVVYDFADGLIHAKLSTASLVEPR